MEEKNVWDWMNEKGKPELMDVVTTLNMVDEHPLDFDFSYDKAYDRALAFFDEETIEINLGAVELINHLGL